MTISPRGDSSIAPFSHSVLGSRPICTKMPSSSIDAVRRWCGPCRQAGDLLAVAQHLGGLRLVMT
jgi:hypothetical protein